MNSTFSKDTLKKMKLYLNKVYQSNNLPIIKDKVYDSIVNDLYDKLINMDKELYNKRCKIADYLIEDWGIIIMNNPKIKTLDIITSGDIKIGINVTAPFSHMIYESTNGKWKDCPEALLIILSKIAHDIIRCIRKDTVGYAENTISLAFKQEEENWVDVIMEDLFNTQKSRTKEELTDILEWVVSFYFDHHIETCSNPKCDFIDTIQKMSEEVAQLDNDVDEVSKVTIRLIEYIENIEGVSIENLIKNVFDKSVSTSNKINIVDNTKTNDLNNPRIQKLRKDIVEFVDRYEACIKMIFCQVTVPNNELYTIDDIGVHELAIQFGFVEKLMDGSCSNIIRDDNQRRNIVEVIFSRNIFLDYVNTTGNSDMIWVIMSAIWYEIFIANSSEYSRNNETVDEFISIFNTRFEKSGEIYEDVFAGTGVFNYKGRKDDDEILDVFEHCVNAAAEAIVNISNHKESQENTTDISIDDMRKILSDKYNVPALLVMLFSDDNIKEIYNTLMEDNDDE